MSYKNLRQCVEDLMKTGQMVRIDATVDPNLEAAAIQRRVFAAGGPAIYFASVKGCRFPMVSNLFGTQERIQYIFRDSIKIVSQAIQMGIDPAEILRHPTRLFNFTTPWAAWWSRPKMVSSGPVLKNTTTIQSLPHLRSWPMDGGAYITLPQVYTEDPTHPGVLNSNLGMYRVQISGGKYVPNSQVGIHYQLHRGIAFHHAKAVANHEKLRVNIFIGGPPAMTLAAVMPLPEGMSELTFAGMLNRRRVPMIRSLDGKLPIHAEADFCITGYIEPRQLLPEGPFGDHLGYYSMVHDFPVMRVEQVYHRDSPIWPFTVVGRPPQEDSLFGKFIHQLTGTIIPKSLPGIKAIHAVDDCGVHPLLLAIGTERYTPYENSRRPMELLSLANGILGYGQLSLAKYLFIVAAEDDTTLDVHQIPNMLRHILERADWTRDLHFQTESTTDTLDYTGGKFNHGSKLVVAVAGQPRRLRLPVGLISDLILPNGLAFTNPRPILPGILVIEGEPWIDEGNGVNTAIDSFCSSYTATDPINQYPLIVVVDDVSKATRSLRDFLWTLFTKSDPARDIYGIESFTERKHWGCRGSLVIDARQKTFYPPELEEDPEVSLRINDILAPLTAPGKPLHRFFK